MNKITPERTWEHFSHGADIGVRGFGPDPATAFEEAARALTAVITDPATVVTRAAVHVTRAAPDLEMLLVDWLNAMIFEMATRDMLFGDYSVDIQDGYLTAILRGEPVDLARHTPSVEVKGATLTELAVRQTDADGWLAQCVVDV